MSLKTSLCVSTPAPEFPSTLTSRSAPPVTRHRLRPLCLFKPQLSLHSVLPVGWSCAEFPCEWFLCVFFFFVLCCCVWIQILVIEVCILSPLWSVVTKPPLQKLKIPKEFFFFFFSVPELFESKSALLASSQCVFVFVCVCVHVNPGYFWVGGIQWKHSPECHKETNNPDRITSLLWTEGTWKSEYEYANRSQSSERLFEELLPLFPAINSTNNRLCLSVCHRP